MSAAPAGASGIGATTDGRPGAAPPARGPTAVATSPDAAGFLAHESAAEWPPRAAGPPSPRVARENSANPPVSIATPAANGSA